MKHFLRKSIFFALSMITVLMVCNFSACTVSSASQAQVHVNQGKALADQGKYDEALVEYNKAIKLDPKNELAFLYRGEVYKEKEDYDKALADFDKAIDLAPNDQRPEIAKAITEQLIALAKIQKRLTTLTQPTTSITTPPQTTTSSTTLTNVVGEWPVVSDPNKLIVYNATITGNINDDNGKLTYHLNPTILRTCGGKPNGDGLCPYVWSSTANLTALGIDLDDSGLVTELGEDFPLQGGTHTFPVEVTDGKIKASGVMTLQVDRYDVSAKNGIPGVPGPVAILQQWPQEVVDHYPLPAAKAGQPYGVTLPILGGAPPYDYSQESSSTEGESSVSSIGLQLMYGVVFGTIPTSMVGQTLTFSITVTDANGDVDLYSPEYAIKVLP